MNLQSISRLPDDLPGTLGAPIRREPAKPADPGRWVPASEPGYLRHTKSGAVSHEQFVPASERPAKPAPGLYLDSGEFVPAEQINAQPADSGEVPSVEDVYDASDAAYKRVPGFCHLSVIRAIKGLEAVNYARHIPADRRAEVIRALQAL